MLYCTRIPGADLARFIELLWYCEVPASPHPRERVLPAGAAELIFDLYHDRMPDVAGPCSPTRAVGVQTSSILIDTRCLRQLTGVHFRIGGLRPFIGFDTGELCDRELDLADIWPRTANRLRWRLQECHAIEQRFDVLEQALRTALLPQVRIHPAVHFAVTRFHSPLMTTIAEVAGETGLSQRRFIELFRRDVGVTPKLHCRLRRFQQLLQNIDGARAATREQRWATVAADCGYYDQSHMARDFREFSGITSSAYLNSPGAWMNHVPCE